jgi:hypothetical protein
MTESDPTASASIHNRPRRRRHSHPARGARIAAAGISTSVALSIVAVLGARGLPVAQDQVDVVTSLPGIGIDQATTVAQTVTVDESSQAPIQLTANPVLRAAPATPAAMPMARTNGSR